MDENNKKKRMSFLDIMHEIKEFIFEHSKLFMPIILVIGVLLTVFFAINANQREKLEQEAQKVAVESEATSSEGQGADVIATPEFGLEEDAHPEIDGVVNEYYSAQADGDIDKVSSLNTYLNDIEKIRISELSKYVESYPEIKVYTKPGMTDNSYVAYVCSKVKFENHDQLLPGMQTYYIGMDDSGNYYINDGTYDAAIYDYIKNITLQDDVVDLNNKVVVEYNDLLASDEDLNEFIAYLKEKINEDVGVILAEAETPETPAEETEESNQNVVVTKTVVTKVRATERVNIRKSDSQDADKAGVADANQEFELVEKKGNGWTEIKYNGESAFIKTEYLEDVDAVTVEITGPEAEETDENGDDNDGDNNGAATTDNTTADGQVKVIESGVRIRKEPNTTSDVLATLYVGEKLDYIEETGDWTKIKYKNEYGYIKTEFVERVD